MTWVAYIPAWDELTTLKEGTFYPFQNNLGVFALVYKLGGHKAFVPKRAYIIGEL